MICKKVNMNREGQRNRSENPGSSEEAGGAGSDVRTPDFGPVPPEPIQPELQYGKGD